MTDYNSAYSGDDIDSAVATVKTISTFIKTLLDDVSAAKARLTLGVGTGVHLATRVGCALSNGTDTEHDIDVTAGKRRDLTDTVDIVLSGALTKQLDAAWAVGTDKGGLDTGAVANSTWYHVFLINDISNDVVDVLFSTSYATPSMPSGYTIKRRIGSILTEGSANLRQFIQVGDIFRFLTPENSGFGAVTTGYTTKAIPVPPDVRVEAFGNIQGHDDHFIQLRPVGCDDSNPRTNSEPLAIVSKSSATGFGKWFCLTDTSSQIEVGVSGNITVPCFIEGWRDFLEDS